jgi:hypothetical protein
MLTSCGDIIELQGSVEHGTAISWANFEKMRQLAVNGVTTLFNALPKAPEARERESVAMAPSAPRSPTEHAPLFCLKNRLDKV